MGRYLFFAVFFGFLVGAFQNCGKVSDDSAGGNLRPPDREDEVVIGSTQDYFKVSYDANANGAPGGSHQVQTLRLDLVTGELSYGGGGGGSAPSDISPVCQLDLERRESLDRILSEGSLCHPARPEGDIEYCMAIGVEDIRLEGEPDVQAASLRPVICHNGVFLCQGQDAVFREVLVSLLENPPAGCD